MSGEIWRKAEVDFLMANFTWLNNNQLSARITVLRGNLRTPKAISAKLSYFNLRRTFGEKRAVRISETDKCDCCMSILDLRTKRCKSCDFFGYNYYRRFTLHQVDRTFESEIPYDETGQLNELIMFCRVHGEAVWINPKAH